ncbi:MAG TPA: trigger factor [Myxococcota bacterium]|jgi:trigger factor
MSQDSAASAIRVRATEDSSVVRTLEVSVDVKRVRRAYDRAYQDLAKRAPVRGFRPGKTPRSVLEKLYGAQIGEQIEQSLVAETLGPALEQAGLEPVAEPAIAAKTPAIDAEFVYTARVEVKPSFELPELTGLPARRPRVTVGEPDVERELEQLRQRQAALLEEPPGMEAAPAHVLTIDFVGRIDGQPFAGGSGQGVELELGSQRFLPGFEEQLAGAKAGEDREVRVRFPDDYGTRELAGRDAVFAVHVAAIRRRVVPALDDELAKDLGDFESLEALRARVRADLEAAAERGARAELHRTLLDALIARTGFELPPGLVSRQLDRLLQNAARRLAGAVPDDQLEAQIGRWKEEWRPRAEREVREMLLLEAIAKARGIQAEASEIEDRIAHLAREQRVDPARLRRAWGEEGLERALRTQVVDEKVLDFLASTAKVDDSSDS